MFEYEKERLPALQQVVLAGPQTNPQNYYQLFDVFALTSREDPFPLVALEAAVLGKPVICFRQAGGIPEWVEGNGGFCIDYADTAQMAVVINRLADDTLLLQEKSGQIKASVSNYDVNVSGIYIMNIIRRFLKH
jgi:glycosyltransferase involved in cell wall biosynthesis